MVATTTTVYWPKDVKASGFCYGWTDPLICIAGVLQVHSYFDACSRLSLALASKEWITQNKKHDVTPPTILGMCAVDETDTGPVPKILSISISDDTIAYGRVNPIYYYRHASSSLRFYSLEVTQFDQTGEPLAHYSDSGHMPSVAYMRYCAADMNEIPSIEASIAQFNSARLLETALQTNPKFSPANFSSIRISRYVLTPGLRLGGFLGRIMHIACLKLLAICDSEFSSFRLKEISATVQQLDVRAAQGIFLFQQYQYVKNRDAVSLPRYSSHYVAFYNAIWLLLNDVIVGKAFGTFLCENNVAIANAVNQFIEVFLVNRLQLALLWLNNWPAGLKLNTELSQFYCYTLIYLVSIWGGLLRAGASHSPAIVFWIGVASSAGMTMAVSLISDLLTLVTAHIWLSYIISTTIYYHMLEISKSLFNLFRGKRYNVLRNRIDSWDYDIDQLLFGAILFTLVAFLFPTVLVYYSLFAMTRLLVILLQAAMDTLLAFMNHFPLFALMLEVKDPWRLPGGIYFSHTVSRSKQAYMTIENQPVPLSFVFFQYIHLWSHLSSHYHPLRLMYRIFLGHSLYAIPRHSIRYDIASVRASGG